MSSVLTPVVRAVDWDDVIARELRQDMESELTDRHADLFAQLPDLLASDANDVDPDSVVHTVIAEIGWPGPRASVAVGHAALVRRRDGDLEVKRVYVRPKNRRSGVSRELLRALEQFAVTVGAPRLILSTGPRQPEAAALYQAIGYTRIPPYVPPAWRDQALCFEKVLSPSVFS